MPQSSATPTSTRKKGARSGGSHPRKKPADFAPQPEVRASARIDATLDTAFRRFCADKRKDRSSAIREAIRAMTPDCYFKEPAPPKRLLRAKKTHAPHNR